MTETLQAGSAGSDAELITRVRAGDRAAYGELYSRHSTAALTLARQFSRSPAEADDLVSESFARVLDTLIAGGGPDTAFRAYLFTTLRNTAYDRTRKDKRLSFTDDVEAHDVAVDVDDPVVLQAENSLVGKAFNALPERWQAVLWYTQVDGMSPAEAGVLLGMSANAVTSLAYRAREGLREAYLQAHLADTAAERCRTTVDRLGAWARGGLSKREQAQVDAHLAECDRCRALAAELSEINSGIRGMIAPLLLGGAAVAYLAATVVAPPLALVSAGTFLGTQSARDGRSGRGRGRFDRRRARCRCGRRLVAAMGPGQCRRSRRRGGSHRRADHRVERPLDAARGGERPGGHLADCGFRDRPGQHRSWRVGRRHRRRRIYGSGLVRSIRNRQFRSRGDRHRNQRPGHDLKPRRIHWRRRAAGDRAGRHGRRVLRDPGQRIPRSWRFRWRRLRRRRLGGRRLRRRRHRRRRLRGGGSAGGGSAGGGGSSASSPVAIGATGDTRDDACGPDRIGVDPAADDGRRGFHGRRAHVNRAPDDAYHRRDVREYRGHHRQPGHQHDSSHHADDARRSAARRLPQRGGRPARRWQRHHLVHRRPTPAAPLRRPPGSASATHSEPRSSGGRPASPRRPTASAVPRSSNC